MHSQDDLLPIRENCKQKLVHLHYTGPWSVKIGWKGLGGRFLMFAFVKEAHSVATTEPSRSALSAIRTLHKLAEERRVEDHLGLLSLSRCSPSPQGRSTPARARKGRPKRSRERRREQPSDTLSRNARKASGRVSAIQLRVTLERVSEQPLHASCCTACSLGGGAARRAMPTGKRAALSARRGGRAERKGRKRLCDAPSGTWWSRRPAASGGPSTPPLHGPTPTARQG